MEKYEESLVSCLQDYQALIKQIAISSQKLLQADSVAILLYDHIKGRLIPESCIGIGVSNDFLKELIRDSSYLEDSIFDKRWIGINEISDVHDEFLGKAPRSILYLGGIQSIQVVALIAGEERLGIIILNYSRQHLFSAEDNAKAISFANYAALALKSSLLVDQVKRTRNLASVIAELTVLDDLPAIMASVTIATRDVLNCDAVMLYVYDQNNDTVYPPWMAGIMYPDRALMLPAIPRVSLIFRMLRMDEMYVAENVSEDPQFKNRRFVRDEGIKTCIAVPLKNGTEKVGVIFVNYRSIHRFTDDELVIIRLFANQASVAIKNALLYKQLKNQPSILQSLFLSYSHKDEDFAKALHLRLSQANVRVWFAPENVKAGEKLYEQIESAIRYYDRLLLVLSESSMQSEWVITEVRNARKVEVEERRRKLFPIRLVDFDEIRKWKCFDADNGKDLAVEVREYFIPDFSNWNNPDAFEVALQRLLHDLRAEETKQSRT